MSNALLLIIRRVALSIAMCLYYPCMAFRYFFVEAGGLCDVQVMDDVLLGRFSIFFPPCKITTPLQVNETFVPFFCITVE